MAIATSMLYDQGRLRDDYFMYEQELRMRNEYLKQEAKQRAIQEQNYVDDRIKQKPVEQPINKTILLLGE